MFGKFMNKKFFHPGSYPNIKQKWIHEQRAAAKEKAEQEKKDIYQKEQESYQSRLLSAKSSDDKMKLDLNFMYDLPPGLKKDNPEEEDNEDGSKKEVCSIPDYFFGKSLSYIIYNTHNLICQFCFCNLSLYLPMEEAGPFPGDFQHECDKLHM